MALIICPECEHPVSDKALSCPGCGCPIQDICTTEKVSPRSQRIDISMRPRRKYKKLPNGFGSIKKLSGRRSKPFAAYPPTTEFKLNGSPVTVPAIGYYADWYAAFDALREYHHNPFDVKSRSLTFADVYQQFYREKYENRKKEFSKASQNSTRAAYNNCAALHDRKFLELKKQDLQQVVDSCPLKHASLELIVSLFHEMYKYAVANDILDKDYSQFVTINIPEDDEKGSPFSQEELDILWTHKDAPFVDTILIMIYSGFRISAYKTMIYNLEERYFQGGVKTANGKMRIVPIHDSIYDMVCRYAGSPFYKSSSNYRLKFYSALEGLGIASTADGKKHTPHDCRHTFSWLCDKYKVDNLSKHLLMGHSLGNDVEDSVYGHRTLEELRAEIQKIQV